MTQIKESAKVHSLLTSVARALFHRNAVIIGRDNRDPTESARLRLPVGARHSITEQVTPKFGDVILYVLHVLCVKRVSSA